MIQWFAVDCIPLKVYNNNTKYRTENGVRFVKSWEIGFYSWFPTFLFRLTANIQERYVNTIIRA